jgi:hypothetical protein
LVGHDRAVTLASPAPDSATFGLAGLDSVKRNLAVGDKIGDVDTSRIATIMFRSSVERLRHIE